MNDILFPRLGFNLKNVNEYINIFKLQVPVLYVFILGGIILGLINIVLWSKRWYLNPKRALKLSIITIVVSIIGGRISYVLLNKNFEGSIWGIELSFYFAIIIGLIFAKFCSVFMKINTGDFYDCASISLCAGQIIGFAGFLFSRSMLGWYTNFYTKMMIPVNFVSDKDTSYTLSNHMDSFNGIKYISVHPIFLYEIILSLIILLVLLSRSRKRGFPGELFFIYLVMYSAGDFFIEIYRMNPIVIKDINIDLTFIAAPCIFVLSGSILLVRGVLSKKRGIRKSIVRRRRKK